MPEDTAPARAKGPPVWLDMDQAALDDAYDQSVWASNQPHVQARREVANKRAREALGEPQRIPYGKSDIEGLDVFRTRSANAPIAVYIHGGAWRNGRSANYHAPAEMFVNAGAHYIAVDFANVDDAKGSLFPMVDQVRRAVGYVWKNARDLGGDPSKVYVFGHSSGGHLTSCVVTTDWQKDYDLPNDILAGAMVCSGMYDLTPVRLSKRSKYVAFTDQMVEQLSAMRRIDRINMPLVLGYGTCESPEFQRQGRDFHAALTKAGKQVDLVIGEGFNHFEIFETLSSPHGLLGRRALKLMGLGRG
ncbi:MAG: alpha/beta hydrolase [Hyphomicrobiaceae bacterium]